MQYFYILNYPALLQFYYNFLLRDEKYERALGFKETVNLPLDFLFPQLFLHPFISEQFLVIHRKIFFKFSSRIHEVADTRTRRSLEERFREKRIVLPPRFILKSRAILDKSGLQDLLVTLSTLLRGSIYEKLRWTFKLYDINGDGCITRGELGEVVTAVHELMGRRHHADEERKAREQLDRVFKKLDLNQDGVITIEEFIESCLKVRLAAKQVWLRVDGNMHTVPFVSVRPSPPDFSSTLLLSACHDLILTDRLF